jgi:hypothetical protein
MQHVHPADRCDWVTCKNGIRFYIPLWKNRFRIAENTGGQKNQEQLQALSKIRYLVLPYINKPRF